MIGFVVVVLIGVWIAGTVMAQGGSEPQQGPPPPPPPVSMKAGPAGIFTLAGDTLVKYDASLTQVGTLKLVDQAKAPATQDGAAPPPHRLGPAVMQLTTGDNAKVLVLMGGQFFSIDAASMEITAKTQLPAPPKPPSDNTVAPANQPGPGGPRPPQPNLEVNGRIAYVMHGDQIIATNIDDGTLAGQAALPKPTPPAASK
jgi:hypothetical protein